MKNLLVLLIVSVLMAISGNAFGHCEKNISAGDEHGMALDDEGKVYGWGAYGNDSDTPDDQPEMEGVSVVSAGDDHSLVRKGDGTVWALGSNSSGQIGDGTNNATTSYRQVKKCINYSNTEGICNDAHPAFLDDIITVSAGAAHSLALDEEGNVWAWGANSSGQLGNGTYANKNMAVRVCKVKNNKCEGHLTNIKAIAAGGYHSLALSGDGFVWAWGDNSYKQLGMIGRDKFSGPIPVALSDITAIAAGYEHNLALKSDGRVLSWGRNNFGQLGVELSPALRERPNPSYVCLVSMPGRCVTKLDNVKSIAAGRYHGIAVRDPHQTVWAWGSNGHGELGNNKPRTYMANPQQVVCKDDLNSEVCLSHLLEIKSVYAGNNFSLALDKENNLWGWGANNVGQLGIGGEGDDVLIPHKLPGRGSHWSLCDPEL